MIPAAATPIISDAIINVLFIMPQFASTDHSVLQPNLLTSTHSKFTTRLTILTVIFTAVTISITFHMSSHTGMTLHLATAIACLWPTVSLVVVDRLSTQFRATKAAHEGIAKASTGKIGCYEDEILTILACPLLIVNGLANFAIGQTKIEDRLHIGAQTEDGRDGVIGKRLELMLLLLLVASADRLRVFGRFFHSKRFAVLLSGEAKVDFVFLLVVAGHVKQSRQL